MLYLTRIDCAVLVKQENKSDLQVQEADYGSRCSELSQSLDHVMLLLRMCVERSILPSIPCTPTWSMKVTKSTLTLFQHLRLVRPTKEKDCSLSESGKMWPTPTQRDYKGTYAAEGLIRKDGKSRMDQLPNAVKF